MLRDLELFAVCVVVLAVDLMARVLGLIPEPLPNNVVSLDARRAREQSKEARR